MTMKKINYRITVNINERIMKLGFRGQLSEDRIGKKVRVQAVFTQRQVDRRFPMEVHIEETDIGPQIYADAMVELPYVFMTPPRRRVNVTFALWYGMEEIILDDQPFPVQKELFARTGAALRQSYPKFLGLSVVLPVLLARAYFLEKKNMEKAKKKVNDFVYRSSGISYSPRQRKTGYFAARYQKEVKKHGSLTGNNILFLSERLPEESGNLMRVKNMFEADPDVEITEFVHTQTVDALTKSELKECAEKCAQARVIILEDFYPQLHSLAVRPETTVVQLWHACGAFKTFGLSRMGKQGGAPQSSMNHRNYDLISVSSEQIRGLYAEAFAVPYHKVKALGVPRTDDLFDWQYKRAKREELYRKYPVLKDNKVVLFAPTFRGDGNKDAYYPEEMFDIQYFMDRMPEDMVCIIKHHPFIKKKPDIPRELRERVLDLTGKDHINDLMLVSELLITDYSSSIFEAAVLELPVLFYAFDLEEYTDNRDFYFDYDEIVPGPVEKTLDGLVRRARMMLGEEDEDIHAELSNGTDEASDIQPGNEEATGTKAEQFRKTFLEVLDGHSTKRVYEYIKTHFLVRTEKVNEDEDERL